MGGNRKGKPEVHRRSVIITRNNSILPHLPIANPRCEFIESQKTPQRKRQALYLNSQQGSELSIGRRDTPSAKQLLKETGCMPHTGQDKRAGQAAAQSGRWECEPSHYGPGARGHPPVDYLALLLGKGKNWGGKSHSRDRGWEAKITEGPFPDYFICQLYLHGCCSENLLEIRILGTTLLDLLPSTHQSEGQVKHSPIWRFNLIPFLSQASCFLSWPPTHLPSLRIQSRSNLLCPKTKKRIP